MSKQLCYKDAIEWLARNDDNTWLSDKYEQSAVTASLVEDIYGVDHEKLKRDLRAELKRLETAGSMGWREWNACSKPSYRAALLNIKRS